MDAVAPGRDGLDAIIAFAEIEARPRERLAHAGKPLQQGRAIGQHQARDPAQDLAAAGRQMELALPDIDPHIVGAGADEGVAGEAEPGHVEERGQALLGHGGVDVAETDDVADILDRAIVATLFHGAVPNDNRSCGCYNNFVAASSRAGGLRHCGNDNGNDNLNEGRSA